MQIHASQLSLAYTRSRLDLFMSWYYQVIPVQKEVPIVFRVGVGESEEEDKKKKKLFEKLFIHRR